MADPSHRWQPPTKPRVALVLVPRRVILAFGWFGVRGLLTDLHDWVGWRLLTPFAATAGTMALIYLVLAVIDWRNHARH